MKDDFLRQYNYLVYAYLDAGLQVEAKRALFAHFEIDREEALFRRFSGMTRWQHALIARYCADMPPGELQMEYLDWASGASARLITHDHPWQLWTRNMGMLAERINDTRSAVDLYRQSMELCLSTKNGPTVHVMSLLPMTDLNRLGCATQEDREKTSAAVIEAAGMLDRKHFSFLLDGSFDKALETVANEPLRCFPFTYR